MKKFKELAKKRITVDAELVFNSEDKLIGWIFRGKNQQGKDILNALLDGDVSGLPYCEKTIIKPFAGGCGQYLIGYANV